MFYKNKKKNKKKNQIIFQNRFGISFWIAVLFLAIFLNTQNIFVCNAAASGITSEKLVELTNQSRAEQGIEKLTINQNLISAANSKARDMFEHNYFAHTSLQEITPWHWIRQAGYSYQYAGENLAMDFVTSEAIHKALIASATHRKNILNANYKEIGIAVLFGNFEDRQTTIIVQMFGAAAQIIEEQKPVVNSNLPVIKKPTVASASININKSPAVAEKINKSAIPNNNLSELNEKELVLSFDEHANLNSHQNEQALVSPIEPNEKLSFSVTPYPFVIPAKAGIQYFNPSLFIWIPNQVGNDKICSIPFLELDSNGRIKNTFENNNNNFVARHNQGNSILETVFYSKLMLNSFEEFFSEIPEYLSCFLFGRKIDAYMK